MPSPSSPIITSMLDQDLYKLTMLQVYYHWFQEADDTEFKFKCRTPGFDLRTLAEAIMTELEHVCTLGFTREELKYLSSLPYLKKDFIDFLRIFRLDPDHISIDTSGEHLDLRFRGPLIYITMFEIFALGIISELANRERFPEPDYGEGRRRLQEKIAQVKTHPETSGFMFTDFGTRRRFNKAWQREVVETFCKELPQNFNGTSNLALARELGIRPIGTMAHEFLQACQAIGPRLIDSQKHALETWAKEYRGQLGIALTDVVGFDAFLQDFDLYFAKLFDGLRHDSGDPYWWTEKALEHYRKLGIDPRSKTLIFSDDLNIPKALRIYDTFKDQTRVGFGIGTNLTNDLGHKPLNIVIKMTRCRNHPVAKISDSAGKEMCEDQAYLDYLAYTFNIDRKVMADN
ncbi:MAG: nicotinate phosphoribosyltransferase [Desulfuromonas sp.]|nr:MAG: nicotinate phosphoribosyltransferase [Desulfuromonas sp.]